ncbi:follicle-stimulating hormone receptor-like [Pollicipes pollicipes]|uniref:follicle-stimulating hormone receptor-like n=1 Tax=Pollicipes pollicipes TaxID=41117 RepID=UPI0018858EAD|nr:follicle-stimulating hormone receptor-like [Pollicipes pollicipes]
MVSGGPQGRDVRLSSLPGPHLTVQASELSDQTTPAQTGRIRPPVRRPAGSDHAWADQQTYSPPPVCATHYVALTAVTPSLSGDPLAVLGAGELDCVCHGEAIKAVPQTLPPPVSLITLTGTGIRQIERDDFLPYALHLRDIVLSKNAHLQRIRAHALRRLPHLLNIYVQHAPSLESVSPRAWYDLPALRSLDLDGNRIKSLPSNSINITTDQLSLANSQLESISDWAFNGSRIGTLQLNGNLHLKRLDRLAFRGLGSLRTLDLSDTALLSLPTVGLEDIERLLVKRTPSLMTFPSVYHFGSIEEAHLTYPYHCCAFDFPAIQDPDQHRKYQVGDTETAVWADS